MFLYILFLTVLLRPIQYSEEGTMKRYVFVSAVLIFLLIGGSALAADRAGATYNWTGFYGGLNAGSVINNSSYKVSPGGTFLTDPAFIPDNPLRTDTGHFNNGGFAVGAQLGYNHQIGRFVLGAETDFDYSSLRDTDTVNRPLMAPLAGDILHSVNQKVDFVGTLRGRLGFTPLDRLLVYGTGGLAYGHVVSDSMVMFSFGGDTYVGSTSTVRLGWTAGGGGEYAITKNLTVKLEYLYVDLGKESYTDKITDPGAFFPGIAYQTDIETREHMIRFGINYKF
jgi:outer membrane immunogenic protein